jgi:hypothetical protein
MYWKGVECKRSDKYGWRRPEPGDVDLYGKPVDTAYFTLVKIDDCPTHTDEHGRTVYEPKGVKQAVVLSYSGTWYGYGKKRNRNSSMVEVGEGEDRHYEKRVAYTTSPFYAVKDGIVWQGTIQSDPFVYCPNCDEPSYKRDIYVDEKINEAGDKVTKNYDCPQCMHTFEREYELGYEY